MRLLLRILAGLVVFILVAVGLVYGVTTVMMRRTYQVTHAAPAIPSDSASLARGRHLATAIGKCVDCHGADLGGRDFIDGGPLGHLFAPNLTAGAGGMGKTMTDAQWDRSIRHGVRGNGTSLWFMPSEQFQYFTDEDFGALVAYLKSLPPVNNTLPKSSIGPLGRALYIAGQFPFLVAEAVDQARPHPASVAADGSPKEGAYLAQVGGCTGCHGPNLSGGKVPGTPPDFKPASNLTPTGIGHYTETDFFRALREGKRPNGAPIDSFMPFRLTKEMTDEEIRAVFAFLKTVPARPYGNR
jgi:mono/diheme cytochrome c family protein